MRILYIDWNGLCAKDVKLAFKNLGYHYDNINAPKIDPFEFHQNFADSVEEAIDKYKSEIVFSMNFFPSVAVACNEKKIKYVSWIYDNPHTAVYDKSVLYDFSYVFSFDSYMVEQLNSRGATHVYYAPLAANAERLSQIKVTSGDVDRYACDVAFVGSLYNEGTDYYSTMIARANDEYFTGYLEGLLNAQKKVLGYNFMAEAMSPRVIDKMTEVAKDLLPDNNLLKPEEIYSDVFLSRKLATINRVELLYILGNYFDVNFYTYKETPILNVKHCGTVDYDNEMPKLFKVAKININDTRRSIKNGIPLRAIDIMGAGGFLLSNYQVDFYNHFEPGVHMEIYTSIEEAIDKCAYYIEHEEERKNIANSAKEIIRKEHTYEIRLKQIFEIVKD